MTATWRFGRIGGIDIGINWSWLVVLALVTWSLGGAVFPETNPGLGDATYFAMAAVAVPVFFGCLLLHELGHAIVAKREGMQIDGITLWVFGGVARFIGRFPSAGAELRIALAGPLVSLVLGAALLGTAVLVPLPPGVDGVVHWLGYINLTLLAFNLLPAFPLDGGRVLRALLWRARGDLAAATRTAAVVGGGFGRFMIAAGVLLAVVGGGIGGLWLALIGWFLLGAAEAEAAEVRREAALAGRTVADAMVSDPVTVAPDLPLDRFLDVVLAHRHSAYPVLEGERPVGLITFNAARSGATVADAMTPASGALVLTPQSRLADALPGLLQAPAHRALVIDATGLRGLLSITDVVRMLEVLDRPASDLQAAA